MQRKVLVAVVSSMLVEAGFDSCQNSALETLVEILQSLVTEIGKSSRLYCELTGRTEPLAADVILTLINMGLSLSELDKFARRPNKTMVPGPVVTTPAKQLGILQAGHKQAHPSHIPSHLPPFPDPHAYIRTPTHKQPVTEYEAIREKSAQQKKDIERALNKFETKINETDSLFLSQDNIFPLIACKPQTPPYMVALLPKDQIFEMDEDRDPTKSTTRKRTRQTKEEEEEELARTAAEQDTIDNPYLRPVKLPPPKIKIKDLLAMS